MGVSRQMTCTALAICAVLVATTGVRAQSVGSDLADDGKPMVTEPHYIDDNAVYCGSDGRCSTPLGRSSRRPNAIQSGDGPSAPSIEQPDRSWHLLSQSYGGTVSLLKDLTKQECEFAMHRLKGEPATDEEKKRAEADSKAMWDSADKQCAGTIGLQFRGNVSCHDGKASEINSGGGDDGEGAIKSAECFQ